MTEFAPRPEWLQPQPAATATALPAPFYVGDGAAALDRRSVFARSWQLVADASRIAEPGDVAIAEIAGTPLLLVRGEDGVLRALHNVCRHRAGPLARCDAKGAKALRCAYHGWTYTLDGRLRAATEMSDAERFDVASIRLPEAAVAEWQGLVFAALEPAHAPPFAALVAGIDARVRQDLSALRFDHRRSYDVACNWKAYVDNYLEGYHLPHVHPGLNRLLDYRSYDTELERWHSLQSSPLDSADNFYGEGEALYYFVFPNTMLNILPGRLQTNRVVPTGPQSCRVEFDFHYPRDRGDDERARQAKDQAFSDEIQAEDVQVCEEVQLRLASGSYHAGRLNPKRESGVLHFHELLRAAYRAAT
ncbi:MAG TPA: aromatic ring-hydroxylating dioxygenase subunit alpha [Xanthomonadales bacterium]|nr:aromatic ring-hydroxylating dioxygenase subunit alpha [Xanthomonadales bacterium]